MVIWQLQNVHGATAFCELRQERQRDEWRLTVYRCGEVIFAETGTENHALHRATEILGVMTELGWTEPHH